MNELFELDLATKSIRKVEHAEGAVIPQIRTSHTLNKLDETTAYLFGGANDEGPFNDLYKLDLTSAEFSQIKLEESEELKLPRIEMHTAHILNGTHLLIVGGRRLE